MKPKVSVIMSVYNEIGYVEEAIRSVINQTFTSWEFIIVIDSMDEDLIRVVKNIAEGDSRIKVLLNATNIGLTKSLNIALAHVEGEFVARMDADDIAVANRFEEQVKFMDEHPDVYLLGSWAYLINEKGDVLGELKSECLNEKISRNLLFKNQFIHSSVMMRYEMIVKYGGYNERFIRSQDYEMWLRVRNKVKFHVLNKFLLYYRKHTASITQKSNMQQRVAGLEMMYNYVSENKKALNFMEKFYVLLFFMKQFYKILRLAFR